MARWWTVVLVRWLADGYGTPVLPRGRRATGTGHRCLMTASEPLNPFGSYQSAVARAVVGEPPSARWL